MSTSILAAAIAIVGATVHTGDGPPLKNASVLIEGEKIVAVGLDLEVPAGARIIEASGLVVTPGLIDPASRLGLVEVNLETTSVEGTLGAGGDPVRAALQVSDTFDPASQAIEEARRGGLTSAVAIPLDGIIQGQSAWIELGDEARVLETTVALHARLAVVGGARGSRSRNFLALRRALEDAELYDSDRSAYERRGLRQLSPTAADLKVLARVLKGKLPVVFEVDRATDIRTSLEIAREYGLQAVLLGAAEGWKLAREIAAAKVPVLINPFENLPVSFDALNSRADNAALLHAAGVEVAFTLRGEAHRAARLRQAAGIAVANGFPYAQALAAVTRVPAAIFGKPELGILRPGARANLVLWTGDPFELRSWAQHVLVGGVEVQLHTRQDLLTERYLRDTGEPVEGARP